MTLIEMLVVLAIIGVALGATMLGLGAATRGVSTEAEAQRLAARIRLAADDAMVTGQSIALTWDGNHYAFSGANIDTSNFGPHDLPRGIRLDMGPSRGTLLVGVDGSQASIRARLISSADSWTVSFDGLNVIATPTVGA